MTTRTAIDPTQARTTPRRLVEDSRFAMH